MSEESTILDIVRVQEQSLASLPATNEKFWRRYSPCHELPLSSASSLCVHVLVVSFLLAASLSALARKESHGDELPLAIYPDDSPASTANEAPGLLAPKNDDDPPIVSIPAARSSRQPLPENLEEPKATVRDFPELNSSQPGRMILDATSAIDALAKIGETSEPLLGPAPADPHAPTTEKNNPRSPPNDLRSDKVRPRWQVNFTVADARDHLRQFAGLGAILAFPDGAGRYHVFRALDRRQAGKVEDVSKIERIWFIDQNVETVAGIAQLLGMRGQPKMLVAFFPKELEAEMERLEKAHREQKKAATDRTFFRVVPRDGRYTVVVADPQ